MDRKTIIVVVICFALMLFGSQIINKMFPPTPLPPGTTNQVATATSPLTNAPAVTTTGAPPTTATATAPTATTSAPKVQYSGTEETLVITNADARYTFTSHGGGLKTVELLKFQETITRRSKKENVTNDVATLNTPHAPPVLSILGNNSVQDDGGFTLTGTTTGVRAEKSLANGLRLVKDFQIGTNHLIHATVRLENTSAQPLALSAQEWVVGTATPMGPDDHGEAVGLMWYNGASKTEILGSWFDNKTLGCFPGTPRPEYRAFESNVVWTAVQNQFFVLTAMFPSNSASAVVARPINLPRPGEGWASSSDNPTPKGFQTAVVFPETTLPAGQTIERQINIYAGPKEYRTLAHIGAQFKNNVDVVMGYDGFFGFFSKVLLLGMNWLHHTLSLPYGWAIIAITIIIKGLFWPLTAASTRSMKRLQALQPQMNAIKEKYKDDPMKMNKKVMEFMKENKVSPLGGCLPMLLQMPVFIGFFFMIRTAIELRGASWLWVPDLSKADTLFFIPGLGIPFNLLPLLMGGTMLWQARLTPPSPGMDPTQAKMMRYMPLIFIVFLYNYSAGLALYWTVNNLLSVLQTKLTKTVPLGSSGPTAATTPASVLTPVSKKKK